MKVAIQEADVQVDLCEKVFKEVKGALQAGVYDPDMDSLIADLRHELDVDPMAALLRVALCEPGDARAMGLNYALSHLAISKWRWESVQAYVLLYAINPVPRRLASVSETVWENRLSANIPPSLSFQLCHGISEYVLLRYQIEESSHLRNEKQILKDALLTTVRESSLGLVQSKGWSRQQQVHFDILRAKAEVDYEYSPLWCPYYLYSLDLSLCLINALSDWEPDEYREVNAFIAEYIKGTLKQFALGKGDPSLYAQESKDLGWRSGGYALRKKILKELPGLLAEGGN